MELKKFENGKHWFGQVICPYCKNHNIWTEMEYHPEVGRIKMYHCSCKAAFWNYPVIWLQKD